MTSSHYVVNVTVTRVDTEPTRQGIVAGTGPKSERAVTEVTRVAQKGGDLPSVIKYVAAVLELSTSLETDSITDPIKEKVTR